jgi:hypothetical protein
MYGQRTIPGPSAKGMSSLVDSHRAWTTPSKSLKDLLNPESRQAIPYGGCPNMYFKNKNLDKRQVYKTTELSRAKSLALAHPFVRSLGTGYPIVLILRLPFLVHFLVIYTTNSSSIPSNPKLFDACFSCYRYSLLRQPGHFVLRSSSQVSTHFFLLCIVLNVYLYHTEPNVPTLSVPLEPHKQSPAPRFNMPSTCCFRLRSLKLRALGNGRGR